MSDVSSIDFRTEDDRRDVLVSVSLSGGGSEDELAALDVTIDADGVHAERGVLTYRGDGFDTFFEGLAAAWKG